MKRISLILLGVMLVLPGVCAAQGPGQPPAVVIFEQEKAPAPTPLPPAPAVAAECKTTVCVTEVKKNTKVVYTSRCKEYCLCEPGFSLAGLFGRGGGGCCEDNCAKRTRNVLVKKVVPDCDTTQCVLKEVPAAAVPCTPCPPCPPHGR